MKRQVITSRRSAQSFMMRTIQGHLTEEEHGVYRRGRRSARLENQSITDYRRATGFEALVGYLYLNRRYERLAEIVTIGLDSMKEKEQGTEE